MSTNWSWSADGKCGISREQQNQDPVFSQSANQALLPEVQERLGDLETFHPSLENIGQICWRCGTGCQAFQGIAKMDLNNNREGGTAKQDQTPTIYDYKDVSFLKRFVSDRGKIHPRRMTGLSRKDQKNLEQAIKRARKLGLMPFGVHDFKVDFNAITVLRSQQRSAGRFFGRDRDGYRGDRDRNRNSEDPSDSGEDSNASES
jgi:ribosomal protein S18